MLAFGGGLCSLSTSSSDFGVLQLIYLLTDLLRPTYLHPSTNAWLENKNLYKVKQIERKSARAT